jgi:hypothetical protein
LPERVEPPDILVGLAAAVGVDRLAKIIAGRPALVDVSRVALAVEEAVPGFDDVRQRHGLLKQRQKGEAHSSFAPGG